MTSKEYLLRFKEITEEMLTLTTNKNHDYASEEEALRNFKEFGAVGVLIRISDKLARLKTGMWEKRSFVINESIQDTIMDLAVYSVILKILVENEDKALKAKYPLVEMESVPIPPNAEAFYRNRK
jgi:hypothetical protein